LLGFGPGGEFTYNEDKKLKADVLLVDEASMLDCQLFVSLLRSLPLTCRLILVGDVNQLPSVGPGNVLSDLLESGAVSSRTLTRIFRQARESTVVVNAHRINQGKFPVASPKQPPEADFFWVEQDDPQKVQDLILNMVCERIPEVYGYDPLKAVQVLTPMHKGLVGTSELNRLLQERLNPSGQEVRSGFKVFRVGDRVLQTRNNYEKDVFNGDLGWIARMDQESGELVVDFDGHRIQYAHSDLDELQLAYCISVHKSQGSEYPAVLIPVVTQHFLLLQRNLIYTALTRATRLAVLVGSKKALGIGINRVGGDKRYTNLRTRLEEAFAL
jgi:exodeoxyribonuclease V alpha subunit